MPKFIWRGLKDGAYTEGEVTALHEDEAAFLLKRDKVIITSLIEATRRQNKAASSDTLEAKEAPSRSVPLPALVMFSKKLAAMVKSGLPILEALKMLRQQTEHKGLRYVAGQIQGDVEGGVNLSDAFAKHPNVFDNVYVNMLRAGESSGKLDEFLGRLVEGMVKTQAIRKKVKSALTYPIILAVVAVAVIAIMMIYVVPVFQDMFKGRPGGLPGPTQLVVNVSTFVRDPMGGGALLVGFVSLLLLGRWVLRSQIKVRRKFDGLLLRLPVVGDLVLHSSLAKVAMIQGHLAGAGVSVLEALDIVTRSLTNLVLQEALTDVKRGVFSGSPLSELFQRRPEVFPMTFSSMVQVGERTGRMDDMFAAIASYYEEETDGSISQLTSMLEPIMIVVLGGIIGFILVAMYMPMFAAGQAL